MSRTPRPWYRAKRDTWYAQIDGKQHALAKGKANRVAAERELYRLLAARGVEQQAKAEGVTVRHLCHDFLDFAKRDRKPNTYLFYRRHLERFCATFGERDAEAITPHEVSQWVNRLACGQTTRHGAATSVKRAFSWGKRHGVISANVIAELEKPKPKQRVVIPGHSDVAAMFAAIHDQPFRDLVTALHQTGCRLGEAISLTASEVDLRNRVWKVDGKTDRPRVIHLTDDVTAICERRVKLWRTGPIFRNLRGNPWTRHVVSWRFKRLRTSLGLPASLTPHALRHLFATDALENSVPIATVSELLGHADTKMVSRVYSHLGDRRDHLKENLKRVRGRQKP